MKAALTPRRPRFVELKKCCFSRVPREGCAGGGCVRTVFVGADVCAGSPSFLFYTFVCMSFYFFSSGS
jgi:hypothetical protein